MTTMEERGSDMTDTNENAGVDETASPAPNITTLDVALPLDRGFLRRECPNCAREFKRIGARVQGFDGGDIAFVCPYCYETGAPDAWWTPEQLRYLTEVAREEVVTPKLRRFEREIAAMDFGGFIKATLEGVEAPPALKPEEPKDMKRTEFPCHQEEPLRVLDEWEFDVACHACGIRYPVRDLIAGDPE